ncbi:MAG TPA: transposase [Microvirga sp.]|nr:transposase [Microvirga sp.]
MVSATGLRRSLKGLSEVEFRERFGTEAACRAALFEMRWREGLSCPGCGHRGFCTVKTRKLLWSSLVDEVQAAASSSTA